VGSFLVFQLYGPMASWGEVAVGEVRASALHPTRSALLGLLAAALGLRRSDRDGLSALAAELRFAVRMESAGVPLTDYHTAQLGVPRRGRLDVTRADQLRDRRDQLQTLLSTRDYRCDGFWRVATWLLFPHSARWSLPALRAALEEPVFPLYLGRKSCPPSLPLAPRVVPAASFAEALVPSPDQASQFAWSEAVLRGLTGPFRKPQPARLFWEDDTPDLTVDRRVRRRDDPDPRRPRGFRIRWEYQAPVLHSEEESDAAQPDSPIA
jgi:CRISPR system Cascade subunit CasD